MLNFYDEVFHIKAFIIVCIDYQSLTTIIFWLSGKDRPSLKTPLILSSYISRHAYLHIKQIKRHIVIQVESCFCLDQVNVSNSQSPFSSVWVSTNS